MFAKVLKVYAISCLRLCNSKVFPFNFTRVADEFAETLLDLQSKGKGILDLNALLDKANELKSLTVTLNSVIDKTLNQYEKVKTKKLKEKSERDFNDLNRCLMCLSRILSSVNYCSSQAGRYGQDRWGERLKPLPALQKVTELASMRANSKEFKGLKTGLIRERNRVSDALQLATDAIKDALERLTCERSEKFYIPKSGKIRA